MIDMKMMYGFMIRKREMPAAFMANNSNLSPKFPKVINEERRIARGSAMENNDRAA